MFIRERVSLNDVSVFSYFSQKCHEERIFEFNYGSMEKMTRSFLSINNISTEMRIN